ncbi:T7SS effector LXG polymorphic toxin [Oceanobacillus kimchii]|uniref:T7SS effector LXG polymorphic toxin n=1 Tax=Oceanobacillus kimchii TaxID=746691 RepID=UPI0009878CD9|nr:T7SS effector LXG polymorphic toxin [Oceanobacillus kimchii]
MGHKVDLSEVVDFSTELKKASEDITSNLNQVKGNISQLNDLSSFSGMAAMEAKNYFNDFHKTVSDSLTGLFDDLVNNVNKHLEKFETDVDSNSFTIIESDYLKNTEADISEYYEKLYDKYEAIKEAVDSVADITAANAPIFYSVNKDKIQSNKVITELDEKLAIFISENDVSEIKDLIHQIESTMNRAQKNEGVDRFADYTSASDNSGLAALKDYNEGKEWEAEIEKAREVRDETLKELDQQASKEVVSIAYSEFENGDIDKKTFYSILSSVSKTKGNINEDNINSEEAKILIEYLEDKKMLDQYVTDNPNFVDYVVNNLPRVAWEATPGALAVFADKLGKTMNELAAYLTNVVSTDALKNTSSSLIDKAGKVAEYGKAAGPAFGTIGFGYGMYTDTLNNDKSVGEAYAHNLSSLLAGVGATAMASFFVSNPVGWAAAGIMAAPVVGTILFEFAYANNSFGIQDGLDWAGNQFDKGWEIVTDWAGNIGQGLHNSWNLLNPFSTS